MKCMATQTTNFNLTKPAYTETADIAVINSNMDTIDTVLANEAEQYDATDAYYVGDYCIYNGVTYRCTVDIETPEAFNSSHWEVVKITDEIANANLKKEQLDEGLAYVAKKVGNNWRLPSGKTANAGDYVIWDGSLGKAKGQIVGGSTNITNSNWEIVSNGALNALNSNITNIIKTKTVSVTTNSDGSFDFNNARMGMLRAKYVILAISTDVSSGDTVWYNIGIYRASTDAWTATFMQGSTPMSSKTFNATVYYMLT